MPRCTRPFGILAVVFCLFLTQSTLAQDAKKPRVFDCDAPVQSYKRGLCVNKMSPEDFAAIAPGVSWFYNWHYETKDVPAKELKIEFLPMMWGDTPERYAGLEKYLASHPKPRAVLVLNEPNLKGQAFIPPEQTAKSFVKTKAIADKHGVPIVGPHMALGSAPKDSITAEDPIEKKQVTYGNMMQFLKAFEHYLGDTKAVSAYGVHAYGNSGELSWAAGVLTKDFGKPIWMTEYAWWNAKNESEELKYLIQTTDLMERLPHVHAYAWFKERVKGNQKISLFESGSGKLTKIGQAYVSLPVHDADVYYRLPGKLSAARYVTLQDMKIEPGDEPTQFKMVADKGGAYCDYNVFVETAGKYTVAVTGTGDFTIAGKPVGDGVQLQLAKGPHTLRVGCSQKGQVIEWISFSK
jgi:hypothetical protein